MKRTESAAIPVDDLAAAADRQEEQAREIVRLRAEVLQSCACLNAALRICRHHEIDGEPLELWSETVKRGMALVAGAPAPEGREFEELAKSQARLLRNYREALGDRGRVDCKECRGTGFARRAEAFVCEECGTRLTPGEDQFADAWICAKCNQERSVLRRWKVECPCRKELFG